MYTYIPFFVAIFTCARAVAHLLYARYILRYVTWTFFSARFKRYLWVFFFYFLYGVAVCLIGYLLIVFVLVHSKCCALKRRLKTQPIILWLRTSLLELGVTRLLKFNWKTLRSTCLFILNETQMTARAGVFRLRRTGNHRINAKNVIQEIDSCSACLFGPFNKIM